MVSNRRRRVYRSSHAGLRGPSLGKPSDWALLLASFWPNPGQPYFWPASGRPEFWPVSGQPRQTDTHTHNLHFGQPSCVLANPHFCFGQPSRGPHFCSGEASFCYGQTSSCWPTCALAIVHFWPTQTHKTQTQTHTHTHVQANIFLLSGWGGCASEPSRITCSGLRQNLFQTHVDHANLGSGRHVDWRVAR